MPAKLELAATCPARTVVLEAIPVEVTLSCQGDAPVSVPDLRESLSQPRFFVDGGRALTRQDALVRRLGDRWTPRIEPPGLVLAPGQSATTTVDLLHLAGTLPAGTHDVRVELRVGDETLAARVAVDVTALPVATAALATRTGLGYGERVTAAIQDPGSAVRFLVHALERHEGGAEDALVTLGDAEVGSAPQVARLAFGGPVTPDDRLVVWVRRDGAIEAAHVAPSGVVARARSALLGLEGARVVPWPSQRPPSFEEVGEGAEARVVATLEGRAVVIGKREQRHVLVGATISRGAIALGPELVLPGVPQAARLVPLENEDLVVLSAREAGARGDVLRFRWRAGAPAPEPAGHVLSRIATHVLDVAAVAAEPPLPDEAEAADAVLEGRDPPTAPPMTAARIAVLLPDPEEDAPHRVKVAAALSDGADVVLAPPVWIAPPRALVAPRLVLDSATGAFRLVDRTSDGKVLVLDASGRAVVVDGSPEDAIAEVVFRGPGQARLVRLEPRLGVVVQRV